MKDRCCAYLRLFTGQAIPAAPGLTAVWVSLDERGDTRVYRARVHAWGTMRETRERERDRRPVSCCAICGEEEPAVPHFSVEPMVLMDGELEPASRCDFDGRYIGVFDSGEDDVLMAEAECVAAVLRKAVR